MIDPTECETLGRRSARRSNRRVEGCKELYKNSYNLPGALAKAVIFAIEAVGTRPTDAIKGAQALCPARWQRLLFLQSSPSERGRPTRSSPRGLPAANKGAQALCMVLEKFTSV